MGMTHSVIQIDIMMMVLFQVKLMVMFFSVHKCFLKLFLYLILDSRRTLFFTTVIFVLIHSVLSVLIQITFPTRNLFLYLKNLHIDIL